MCRVLNVKPSSYYVWINREISEQGHDISLYMVRRIFDEHGIKYRRHKRFKVTTNSDHNKLVYPNVLDQQFDAKRPNESWVSDITYIWIAEGWIYLAGVKVLYNKELVGYAISKRMTADLVCRALNMAIKNKRPSQGLIVHSDRGSKYCSHAYYKIIKQHKLKGSMSRRGNCFDNAPIESFSGEEHCSARKNELLYYQDYKTRFKAINDIIKYIELKYNEERLSKHCFAATQDKSYAHSGIRIQKSLGYKTPRQMWSDFYRQAA